MVVFPTKRVRAYTGTMRVEPWPATEPRYGTLTLRKGDAEYASPLGSDGAFYFESVPAGVYEALVEMGAADCRMPITIPPGLSMITTLGELVCRIGGRP